MVVHKNPYILSCIVKTARNEKGKAEKKSVTHIEFPINESEEA